MVWSSHGKHHAFRIRGNSVHRAGVRSVRVKRDNERSTRDNRYRIDTMEVNQVEKFINQKALHFIL